MSYNHYDRLSALDSAILDIEDGNAHMHLGAVAIFDAAPLTAAEGGIDFERILEYIGVEILRNDRFQQKLTHVPGSNWPVWIDDPSFNLRYHVRQTCLPAPGDERLLKRLAGRIISEELDRGKPLWELWFVDGIEGGRFAVISKVHHAMADWISGADLFSVLMGPDPEHRPKRSVGWEARPAPSAQRLLADEVRRLAGIPFSLLGAGRRILANPGEALAAAQDEIGGLAETIRTALSPAPETAFNQEIGPHRRFDWAQVDMDRVRTIRKQLGGTLNDVVLTVIAGVIRRNYIARGLSFQDLDFRVMVPVNVRRHEERGAPENRVSMLVVPLPLDAVEPLRRFERIREATHEAKESSQRSTGEALAEIADLTGSGLLTRLVRFGLQSRVANLVVTNVPGPPDAAYLLGAKLLEVYPVVPLGTNQALGVALFSYAGTLYWGFNADWDQVPDLHDMIGHLNREFDELLAIAERRPRVVAAS